MKNKQSSNNNGNWFNLVILDVLVTGLVVISTFWMPPLLHYLLYGYSGLLLIMRALTLINNGLGTPMIKKEQQVPDWFYHVNYFICTAIFFITMEYVLGGMWAVIWLLSWISTLKSSRTATSSKRG